MLYAGATLRLISISTREVLFCLNFRVELLRMNVYSISMCGPSRNRRCLVFCLSFSLLVIFNEFFLYYFVMLKCSWPILESSNIAEVSNQEPLKAMFISDTHLLGSRNGHWFDKLRREWQMERSFKTATLVFNPDVIFILGDLFDEGKWSSDREFKETYERLRKIFPVREDSQMQVVVGNHDIGFHYSVIDQHRHRFEKAFQVPSVRLFTIKEIIFVLVNSMSMENDGCTMCREAEMQLLKIANQLQCSQLAENARDEEACRYEKKFLYSQPVLLQHFPLYRVSDENCSGPDAAFGKERTRRFQEKWDTLSKHSSEKLLNWIQPRLVVSGHTHWGCTTVHRKTIVEHSLPSFSWRNINNPGFLLGTFSQSKHVVNKCHLPHESTVIILYVIGSLAFLFFFLISRIFRRSYAQKVS